MTPPSNPSGPEAPETENQALKLFDEMLTLSVQLYSASKAMDTAQVEQLIIRRGMVLEKVTRMQLGVLSPHVQEILREKLEVYAELEPQIEQSLAECKAVIAEQLKAYKEGKVLMNKYKLSLKDGPDTTRSKDA